MTLIVLGSRTKSGSVSDFTQDSYLVHEDLVQEGPPAVFFLHDVNQIEISSHIGILSYLSFHRFSEAACQINCFTFCILFKRLSKRFLRLTISRLSTSLVHAPFDFYRNPQNDFFIADGYVWLIGEDNTPTVSQHYLPAGFLFPFDGNLLTNDLLYKLPLICEIDYQLLNPVSCSSTNDVNPCPL